MAMSTIEKVTSFFLYAFFFILYSYYFKHVFIFILISGKICWYFGCRCIWSFYTQDDEFIRSTKTGSRSVKGREDKIVWTKYSFEKFEINRIEDLGYLVSGKEIFEIKRFYFGYDINDFLSSSKNSNDSNIYIF